MFRIALIFLVYLVALVSFSDKAMSHSQPKKMTEKNAPFKFRKDLKILR